MHDPAAKGSEQVESSIQVIRLLISWGQFKAVESVLVSAGDTISQFASASQRAAIEDLTQIARERSASDNGTSQSVKLTIDELIENVYRSGRKKVDIQASH